MMAEGRFNPLASGCPPRWASEWGQDEFGVFVGFAVGRVEQRMRWVGPGEFMMGSPGGEAGRWVDEGPRHRVVLAEGFWLGETPVTQALWEAVMAGNPSHFKGRELPVEMVSWEDCQGFCARLGERVPGIRLPREAEWEYGCRAGSNGARYGQLDTVAWHERNSDGQTHLVRQKMPNAWGLYDMLGNVWEWCRDGQRPYSSEQQYDPCGPLDGVVRVLRGGSWDVDARDVRAAFRSALHPGLRSDDLGFRLARGQE